MSSFSHVACVDVMVIEHVIALYHARKDMIYILSSAGVALITIEQLKHRA